MSITIIAAMAFGKVIGNKGKLPWGQLSPDLKRFKALTMGHTVVMGYETFISIGKPLPGRDNIILTHHPEKLASWGKNISFTDTIETILEIAERKDVFIIGGENVYRQFIQRPETKKMYITCISADFEGDTFFPGFSIDEWKLTEYEPQDISVIESNYPIIFATWIRK